MKLTLITIATLLVGCASACAQEMSASSVPVFSWTGSYIGIYGGGLKSAPKASWEDGGLYSAREVRGFDVRDGLSGMVGVQVGYDYQIDHLVLGLAADIAYSANKTKIDVDGPIPGSLVLNSKTSYIGTVRGRVGYAMDRALLYAHGGLAIGKIEDTYEYKTDPGGGRFDKENSTGYVAGAGVEYAFTDHLSGQFEYSFIDLGKHDLKTSGNFIGISERAQFHSVKAGINYRF